MNEINTCFIFDFMGDLDEEVSSAIMELNSIAGMVGDGSLPIVVKDKSTLLTSEILEKKYDLMIIDYGGLSPGSSAGDEQIDTACRYAEDHPGCLLIIWTGFTAMIYEDELEDKFGHLSNIAKRYIPGHVYENLDGSPEFISKFKNWFNI